VEKTTNRSGNEFIKQLATLDMVHIMRRFRAFLGFFPLKKQPPGPFAKRLELSTITSSQEWAICKSFGAVFHPGLSIRDAGLLPCPKERGINALKIVEQRLCDKGNELTAEYAFTQGFDALTELRDSFSKERQLVDKYLESIRSLSVLIEDFVEIDPQDQTRVNHFNSLPSIRDVPQSEKREWLALVLKYGERASGPRAAFNKESYNAFVQELESQKGQKKLK
jgi:hypothetical protein